MEYCTNTTDSELGPLYTWHSLASDFWKSSLALSQLAGRLPSWETRKNYFHIDEQKFWNYLNNFFRNPPEQTQTKEKQWRELNHIKHTRLEFCYVEVAKWLNYLWKGSFSEGNLLKCTVFFYCIFQLVCNKCVCLIKGKLWNQLLKYSKVAIALNTYCTFGYEYWNIFSKALIMALKTHNFNSNSSIIFDFLFSTAVIDPFYNTTAFLVSKQNFNARTWKRTYRELRLRK